MPVLDEPKKRTSPSGQSNTMYGKIATCTNSDVTQKSIMWGPNNEYHADG